MNYSQILAEYCSGRMEKETAVLKMVIGFDVSEDEAIDELETCQELDMFNELF